jgi:hypothetical protein
LSPFPFAATVALSWCLEREVIAVLAAESCSKGRAPFANVRGLERCLFLVT